jgi:hypothetical protein
MLRQRSYGTCPPFAKGGRQHRVLAWGIEQTAVGLAEQTIPPCPPFRFGLTACAQRGDTGLLRWLISLPLFCLLFALPSPSLPQSPADVDFSGNGVVDFADFIFFAQAFGSSTAACDLDGSGTVDFPDFLLFARVYGQEARAVPVVRDIGVPVRSVNWVRLHHGRDSEGRPAVYATMGQQGDNLFVLQIDPSDGSLKQFVSPVSRSNYPTATLLSRYGKLYIGSAYAGHLLRFDFDTGILEDLGAINPKAATFPCRMDEDAAGHIWIGSYPTADLTEYDPRTGVFTRHGRMDDVDMYNYPLVGLDGRVGCLIRQTVPHVVVYDPVSGTKRVVGPLTTKGVDTIDLRKGRDGVLYIVSNLGKFKITEGRATEVDQIVGSAPSPTLPDGSRASFADASSQTYKNLSIRDPSGQTTTFELDYKASGTDVFVVHLGPDSLIYGSSILPEHLFRFDPSNENLIDLGKCSTSGGEAYSMANLGEKLYISSYPAARISEYTPGLPYRFGTDPDANPLELGRIDDISYRPRSTLAGPLDRVWTASLPDYGLWGGPLSWLDPATGARKAYYRIVGDASCYTLAHLEKQGLIAVGTSVYGGSGTKPKVSEVSLFLWDYTAEQKVWEGTLPDRPVSIWNALLTGEDGRLYGTVRGGGPDVLFVFDPASRTFTHQSELPYGRPLDLGLQQGPDGLIYGFTVTSIYTFDPESHELSEVVRVNDGIKIAGPIADQDIYFGTGPRLRAARLFD